MIRSYRVFIGATLFASTLAHASGDWWVSDYESVKSTEAFKQWLVGVEAGIAAYNASLSSRGKQTLYCPLLYPDITKQQLIGIMERAAVEAGKDARMARVSLSQILVRQLATDFPCK